MSAYEIVSMMIELRKMSKPAGMDQEELDGTRDWLADMFKNDPSVKLR